MKALTLVTLAALTALFAGCVKRDPLPNASGSLPDEGAPLALSLPLYSDGKVHDLASDHGKVVLLDVWATWCEPCRDALPLYEQLVKQYGEKGLRVYAVNVDVDQREIPKFIQETKLSIPILLDQIAEFSEHRLNVKMMPISFLLDRRGTIRFVHEDFAEEFLAKYQAEIEQLLAEPGGR